MSEAPEETFSHTLREGIVAGLIVAAVMEAVLVVVFLLIRLFGMGAAGKAHLGQTIASVTVLAVLFFVFMIAMYHHSSRYTVVLDGDFIILRKSGIEYDKRMISGFTKLRTSIHHPRFWLEFRNQPDLPIQWLASWKIQELTRHLAARN